MKHKKEVNVQNSTTELAADMLLGAKAIAKFLRSAGFSKITISNVYYLYRVKKLPIGKFGNDLIASKSKIIRHVQQITEESKPQR